jgi:hypothetical protein
MEIMNEVFSPQGNNPRIGDKPVEEHELRRQMRIKPLVEKFKKLVQMYFTKGLIVWTISILVSLYTLSIVEKYPKISLLISIFNLSGPVWLFSTYFKVRKLDKTTEKLEAGLLNPTHTEKITDEEKEVIRQV